MGVVRLYLSDGTISSMKKTVFLVVAVLILSIMSAYTVNLPDEEGSISYTIFSQELIGEVEHEDYTFRIWSSFYYQYEVETGISSTKVIIYVIPVNKILLENENDTVFDISLSSETSTHINNEEIPFEIELSVYLFRHNISHNNNQGYISYYANHEEEFTLFKLINLEHTISLDINFTEGESIRTPKYSFAKQLYLGDRSEMRTLISILFIVFVAFTIFTTLKIDITNYSDKFMTVFLPHSFLVVTILQVTPDGSLYWFHQQFNLWIYYWANIVGFFWLLPILIELPYKVKLSKLFQNFQDDEVKIEKIRKRTLWRTAILSLVMLSGFGTAKFILVGITYNAYLIIRVSTVQLIK
jgi:hypothetical protein